MPEHPTAAADDADLPINELEQVLASYPKDVQQIFGPALTIFAGPFAAETDSAEKLRQLEGLIQKAGSTGETLV